MAGRAAARQACLSTLAFISRKQMGRRGKTVPRGMYETYDLRLVTILRMGWEQGRIYCLASVLFSIDELTNSNPASTTSSSHLPYMLRFLMQILVIWLPPCSR